MKTEVVVTDLRLDHLQSAMPYIRKEDQYEWLAGVGTDVVSGLSTWRWRNGKVAIAANGKVLCFWGVEPDGYVWMAATTRALKSTLALHRIMPREIAALHEIGGDLYCWADARNITHHRWLEWCGFTLVEEKPWGLLGLPFKHYRRERNVPLTGYPGRDRRGLLGDGDAGGQ